MQFRGPDTGGTHRSECGRYRIDAVFSPIDGRLVHKAWRLGDEVSYPRPLGQFFKVEYAKDACRLDAGMVAAG